MRFPTLILAVTGASMLTGCSSLVSLNPFVTDAQSTTDPRIVGTWKHPKAEDKDYFIVDQKGSLYTVKYTGDNSQTVNLECRLTRIGDMEFLDLISTDDNAFGVPIHVLARVWPDNGTLKWAFLDSDWIRDQARQNLTTQELDSRTVITTQGDAVTKFLQKFGADDRAYKEPDDLVKMN
jgi:hypothetical protein